MSLCSLSFAATWIVSLKFVIIFCILCACSGCIYLDIDMLTLSLIWSKAFVIISASCIA
jgi:hypothetical protein